MVYNKECIDLARDLNCPTVIWLGVWLVHGVFEEQAWEWEKEALTEISSYASQQGVNLVIEPTSADSNLIDTIFDALRLMKKTNSPNVKVMFDTFHAFYRNEVPAEYVSLLGENLGHVHIADLDRNAPGTSGKDFNVF